MAHRSESFSTPASESSSAEKGVHENPFEQKTEVSSWEDFRKKQGWFKKPKDFSDFFSAEGVAYACDNILSTYVGPVKDLLEKKKPLFAPANREDREILEAAEGISDPRKLVAFARGVKEDGYGLYYGNRTLEVLVRKALERAGEDAFLKAEIAKEIFESRILDPRYTAGLKIADLLIELADKDDNNGFAQEGAGEVIFERFKTENARPRIFSPLTDRTAKELATLKQVQDYFETAKQAFIAQDVGTYRMQISQESRDRIEKLEAKAASIADLRKKMSHFLESPDYFKHFEHSIDVQLSEEKKKKIAEVDEWHIESAIIEYTKVIGKIELVLDTHPELATDIARVREKRAKAIDFLAMLKTSVDRYEASANRLIEDAVRVKKEGNTKDYTEMLTRIALHSLEKAQNLALDQLKKDPGMKKRLEKINKKIMEIEAGRL